MVWEPLVVSDYCPLWLTLRPRKARFYFLQKEAVTIAMSKIMGKSFRKFTYVVYLHGIIKWVGDRVVIINDQL